MATVFTSIKSTCNKPVGSTISGSHCEIFYYRNGVLFCEKDWPNVFKKVSKCYQH